MFLFVCENIDFPAWVSFSFDCQLSGLLLSRQTRLWACISFVIETPTTSAPTPSPSSPCSGHRKAWILRVVIIQVLETYCLLRLASQTNAEHENNVGQLPTSVIRPDCDPLSPACCPHDPLILCLVSTPSQDYRCSTASSWLGYRG